MNVSTLRGFIGNTGGAVTQVVVLLALMPYLAERLGPWQFVEIGALMALGSLLSIFECGIAPGIAAAAARAFAAGGGSGVRAVAAESLPVGRRRAIFAGLTGIGLGALLMFALTPLGGTITIAAVFFTVFSVALGVATARYVGLFLGLGRGHELGAAVALSSAVRALAVVLAVERAGTVDAVMAGLALGSLSLLFLCRRAFVDLHLRVASETTGLASQVRVRTRQSIVTTATTLLGGHADFLVVLFALGVRPALAYALGQALAVAVRTLGAAFEPLSLPFSASAGEGSAVDTYVRPVRARLVFIGLLVVPLAPMMPQLASVWTPWLGGAELALTGVVAAILTVAYGLAAVGIRALAVLREQNRTSTLTALGLVELVLLVLLTATMVVVRGDAIGVALAVLTTRAVMSVFALPILAGRSVGVPALELLRAAYLPFLAIAGATVAVTMTLVTFVEDDNKLLWLPIVAGVSVYAGLAWRFGLDADERGRVRDRFVALGRAPSTEA